MATGFFLYYDFWQRSKRRYCIVLSVQAWGLHSFRATRGNAKRPERRLLTILDLTVLDGHRVDDPTANGTSGPIL